MESERETRKRRIDLHLKAAGWTVVPYSPTLQLPTGENLAIEEYPTANGPADYAFSINGEIVGVVEAKKVTLGPQNVLTQSQRYASGLSGTHFNLDGHYVPFLLLHEW